MREASCWSDHQLVRARLSFYLQNNKVKHLGRKHPLAVHTLVSEAVRKQYQKVLTEKVSRVSCCDEAAETC